MWRRIFCAARSVTVLERVEDVEMFGVKVTLVSDRAAERYRGM